MTDKQHARRISRLCDDLFEACKAAVASGLEVSLDVADCHPDETGLAEVPAVYPLISRTYKDELQ